MIFFSCLKSGGFRLSISPLPHTVFIFCRNMDSDSEKEVSELGTHEYWEKSYKEEVKNFISHGDVGDIWFGEDIVYRIINWIVNNSSIKKTDYIADIGCGNGMLLIELYKEGYHKLLGLDYSESAITLAKAISKKRNFPISYEVSDILENDFYNNTFDVVLDKGTFDAISLSENAKINQGLYLNNVYESLKVNGLLIITSCNWTKEELDKQFESKFMPVDVIPTPQFKFGGKVGNVVTCVIYKKK